MKVGIIHNSGLSNTQQAIALWYGCLDLGWEPRMFTKRDAVVLHRDLDCYILINYVPKGMAEVCKAMGHNTFDGLKNKVYIHLENAPLGKKPSKVEDNAIEHFNRESELFNPDIISFFEPGVSDYAELALRDLNLWGKTVYDKGALYHPRVQHDAGLSDEAKRVDVVFVGSDYPRRMELVQILRDAGIFVKIYKGWGWEKMAFLNHCKVSISSFKDDENCIKLLRAIDSIMSGCLYVSDHFEAPSSLVVDKHFLMAGKKRIVEVVKRAIDDYWFRRDMVECAQEHIKANMCATDYLIGLREHLK